MDILEEDYFGHIQKGNAFESANDHWRSAEFYSRASVCLRARADDLSLQIRKGGHADGPAGEEKRKVVSLFRAQSLEYLYKSRHCLLEALSFENEQDRSRTLEVAKSGTGSLDPLFSLITEEESEKRKQIFERLFSGGGESLESKADVADVGTQVDSTESADGLRQIVEQGATGAGTSEMAPTNAIDPENCSETNGKASIADAPLTAGQMDERRESIESRLADLDSSLLPKVPPPFISGSRGSAGTNSQNRIEEIQRGLGRLGVSIPESKNSDFIPENVSPADQVKLIIQQAKDEVRVEKGMHIGEGVGSNGPVDTSDLDDDEIDENDSMFDGFVEDDDLDVDALLAKAEKLVAKTGIHTDGEGESNSELVQIRKVQALLLEARLCLEVVLTETSDEQISPYDSGVTGEDKIEDDKSIDISEDSVESDHPMSGSTLVTRKKAKELIDIAQDSLKKLQSSWK